MRIAPKILLFCFFFASLLGYSNSRSFDSSYFFLSHFPIDIDNIGGFACCILYIVAECKPFSKIGGVSDVAGSLPIALKEKGVDIEIVTPFYGRMTITQKPFFFYAYTIPFNGRIEKVEIWKTVLEKGVIVNFIKNLTYFEINYSQTKNTPFQNQYLFKKDYSKPYVDSDQIPFYDDALRFSFFSEACLPLIEKKNPRIVHGNDWLVGYLFGRMAIKKMPQKRIFTLHNIGYQGNISKNSIVGWQHLEEMVNHEKTQTPFTDPRLNWNSINPLRLAMELSDTMNTVSPTYATEITKPEDQDYYFEGSKGLHEVTSRILAKKNLHGILNGFNYKFYPDNQQFNVVLAKKATMKGNLSKNFKNVGDFLLGFVGRAVEQKFRLLTEKLNDKSVLEHILDIPGVNVAVLATGQAEYEKFLKKLVGRPNFTATIAHDSIKAEQISLGSDVFLMPSLYEPCGITQMESLSYATPPLVRGTGGLADTVKPYVTGFVFDGKNRTEILRNLINTVYQALQLYSQNKAEFQALQWRGFQKRFLWDASAEDYINKLYIPALATTY